MKLKTQMLIVLGLMTVIPLTATAQTEVSRADKSDTLTWSIHTNLLYDAALAPSAGFEVAVGNKWSVGADGYFAWVRRSRHHEWYQFYGFDLYGRYWLNKVDGIPLNGWHVGAYAGTLTYDLYPEGHGYQSPDMFKTFRVGLELGYSTPIGKRWNVDFYGGLGFFHTDQKVYLPNIDCGYHLVREQHRNLPDFTRFGINLTYVIGK